MLQSIGAYEQCSLQSFDLCQHDKLTAKPILVTSRYYCERARNCARFLWRMSVNPDFWPYIILTHLWEIPVACSFINFGILMKEPFSLREILWLWSESSFVWNWMLERFYKWMTQRIVHIAYLIKWAVFKDKPCSRQVFFESQRAPVFWRVGL